MVFLMVISENQVFPFHLIGRFICVLGKHIPSYNYMFVLLGENLGGSLPPIAMDPSAGLVPWLYLEERYQTTAADQVKDDCSSSSKWGCRR